MLIVGTTNGVHRFAREGAGWMQDGRALEGQEVTGLAADDGRVLASVRGQGVLQSDDTGRTWGSILDGVDARCVGIGPDGSVLVGAYPAALYRCVEPGDPFEELPGVRSLPSYPSWNFP